MESNSEKVEQIRDLYFQEHKSVVDIANKLDVSKQYVSKVLKNKYRDAYEEEKSRRSKERALKRTSKNEDCFDDISNLRRQTDANMISMSRSRKMSDYTSAYTNLNVYDVVGNSLVFNNKCGARPADLRQKLKLNIYK